MTLNMLFFTITIKMKKMTAEECLQQERIHKIREEHLDKALKHRPFSKNIEVGIPFIKKLKKGGG
ncbi:YrzI family small protein [[Brevibacterium] frigoritolerans]|uniref:YrzI family small protein n=1 Tax=Peribacillus frigoritolerans TaxID=450367 RepID=A0A941J5P9_9BACI|nr:YrzI family small protein [Peribacillus frigoritolerans]